MFFIITIIVNQILPISPLPNTSLSPIYLYFRMSFLYGNNFRKISFNDLPTVSEVIITFQVASKCSATAPCVTLTSASMQSNAYALAKQPKCRYERGDFVYSFEPNRVTNQYDPPAKYFSVPANLL